MIWNVNKIQQFESFIYLNCVKQLFEFYPLCSNIHLTTGWTGCIKCTCKKVIFSISRRRKRVTAAFKTSDRFCLQSISTFCVIILQPLHEVINYKICLNFKFILYVFTLACWYFLSIAFNWIKHEQMFIKYWYSTFFVYFHINSQIKSASSFVVKHEKYAWWYLIFFHRLSVYK